MPERPGPGDPTKPNTGRGLKIRIEKAPLHRNLKLAAVLAIAGLLERGGGHPSTTAKLERGLTKRAQAERSVQLPRTGFDRPEFFTPVPRGEYSPAQIEQRIERLPNGETVLRGVGFSFYRVQKGDTVYGIRSRLSRYPEFSYLAGETNRLKSFNVPPESLQADSWLPIPIEERDRQLSDEQFCVYALQGMEQLRSNKRYGKHVQELEQAIGSKRLVATLLAVAKQESGGKPLGQFELHRYEPKQQAYSYSLFHVLMKGPGLDARRNLDLSEDQLAHPANAAKLFFGFLVEKRVHEQRRSLNGLLPLEEHGQDFAAFYNGTDWKTKNPHYLDNLQRYYGQALELLDEAERTARKATPPEAERPS